MGYQDPHISDKDLLLALDGEQTATRMAKIRAHLAGCWACRERSDEIERTIHTFVRTYYQSVEGPPPADGPRALLKVRLGNLATRTQPPGIFWRSSLVALLAAFAIVRVEWIYRQQSVPNPRLTPGATRLITREKVCQVPTESPTISASLAKQVFEEYGISRPRPHAYEVDFLITPELGGSDDIRNIWPQPYSGDEWNAHVKDALEEHLHVMVCAGRLDLTAAQRDMVHDWVSAYKRYFHTEHPLKEHLSYTKDQPWD
jgi:hypothetical protein